MSTPPRAVTLPVAELPDDVRAHVLTLLADDAEAARSPIDRPSLRRAVARALAAAGVVLAPQAWARTVRELVDELAGLGPLEPLLRDPAVTDVCCNGPGEVWVDRAGVLRPADAAFRDATHLVDVVRRAAGHAGQRWDRAHPSVDARLPGGLRLHAILPPLADVPLVTVRRIAAIAPTWDDLAASGVVPADLRALLVQAVADRANLVVCGRAGAGKTTLLARLLAEVGGDRVVLIEDAPELGRPSPHAVSLRTVASGPDGGGGADVAVLLRNALRMRPDRIVVGEIRGREVAGLLQAMNTGHDGSATTVHANGAADALVRIEGMALLAGTPIEAVRAQVDTAIDLVVALDRLGARREVTEVVAVQRSGGRRVLTTVWRR